MTTWRRLIIVGWAGCVLGCLLTSTMATHKINNVAETIAEQRKTQQELVDRIQEEMPNKNSDTEGDNVQVTPIQPAQPVQDKPKQQTPKQQTPKQEKPKPSREEDRYDFVAEVTAYTAYDDNMNGKGITASGVKARPYHTIAMSRKYPFGTKVRIEGFDCVFVVEDRGGAITGNDIDIFMTSKQEALNFGRRKLKVKIIK
jgi:3D (Asp-Asp-Asp) domain-containing protein